MSPHHAVVTLGAPPIGEVSPYLFGALTKHFGFGMYGGIWDAERDVARADVCAAVRALG